MCLCGHKYCVCGWTYICMTCVVVRCQFPVSLLRNNLFSSFFFWNCPVIDLELVIWLGWLARSPKTPPALAFSELGLQGHTTLPSNFIWVLESNLNPHSCMANTIPAMLSYQQHRLSFSKDFSKSSYLLAKHSSTEPPLLCVSGHGVRKSE